MSQKKTKWFNEETGEVIEKLGTDQKEGLSSSEAKQRLEHYGKNKLTEKDTESKWMKFLKQFRSGVIYILIASAVITLLLGQYIDAAVIIVVIFANALIGFFQESKAEEALKSIQNMLSIDATVIREGKRMDVEAETIVPGDLIYLEAGDSVPADLRIVQSGNLRIQESSLTGESESVEKQTEAVAKDTVLGDRTNMAFSSTNVTKGNGLGIVVEIGDQIQIGQISESMAEVRETKTPLMKQTDKVAKMNSIAVIILGVFLFAFAYFFRDYEQGELFLAVITMVVGTIPEGLPAILSMTMAIGVQKMAKEHAIVKSLPSVETLGAVNVINTDKTGTLTKNEMTVQDIMTTEHTYKVTGRGYAPEGTIELDGKEVSLDEHPDLDKLIRGGQIANDSSLSQEDGKWIINGEPTDACFLTLAKKVDKDKQDFQTIDTIPFDTDYNFVARLIEWDDGKRQIFLKGAPDKLFSLAEKQESDFDRDIWQERMAKMTAKGERVIGVACKEVDPDEESLEIEDVESGVEFIGLAGIIDPPREAVIDAVQQAKQAGITIKMITGDHPDTAVSIGKQIGLTNGEGALSGQQLDQMSEEEVREAVKTHNVFARMSPDNKLQIVTALQEIGMTISMTGDGVNDAPALKKADIGVSMGIKGTETA
ncbi:cation-translocating P-type ATPase [Lacticigenium naphthae]|uniref:cation-translocating P-type ATPase n=1 Tax=Lacticigenium naphthae TaxID=515351 RepID=UPI00040151D1|nr:HAD-IC family P-type ATPase [Lacticigenium naphthae]